MADQLTGLYAATAVLAGLRHHYTTGEGVHLEVSMLASCLAFQTAAVADVTMDQKVAGKSSRARKLAVLRLRRLGRQAVRCPPVDAAKVLARPGPDGRDA